MAYSTSIQETFKNITPEEKEKFFAALESQIMAGGKMIEKSWSNLEASHARIGMRMKYEHPAMVQVMGDMMMFGMAQQQRPAIFSAPKRKYPIHFTGETFRTFDATYSIPEGYEVISLPKSVTLTSPIGDYSRAYAAVKGGITVREVSSFRYTEVPAAEYGQIQAFMDEMPKSTNDKVVIKKKNTVEK
jgi:hypothetical protein